MLYLLLSDKIYYDNDSNEYCIALKFPTNLSYLFSKVNNFSSDISNSPNNAVDVKHYGIDQLPPLKKIMEKIYLSQLS